MFKLFKIFLAVQLYKGIFLKFDGIFLSEVMGFGPEALAIIMTVMILIVVSYTILGGMFSIVITDFMQFVVLAFGMLVATLAVLGRIDLASISTAVSTTLGSSGVDPFAHP